MTSIAIAIADVVVRQDSKGRYNLNDFHRAAGEENRHRPSLWAENQQAKDLAAEIAQETGKAGIPALVLQRETRALNTAGKAQATLARATTNNIRLDPAKTVEQIAAAAVRSSQINRPAKASKKVAV